MTFDIIDAPQRSEAWFLARSGRLTGSVASDMLATVKSGEAAGRRNLRLRLVLERLTGKPQEAGFVSPAMQAGIDREADAVSAYEDLTGNLVWRTGFLASREHLVGASLDGHLGNFERLVSIKCRQPSAHLDHYRSRKVPSDALAQMRHELWVTGAKEHHYFNFNPDFPADMQCVLTVLKREDADIEGYERSALAFLAEVEQEMGRLQSLRGQKPLA